MADPEGIPAKPSSAYSDFNGGEEIEEEVIEEEEYYEEEAVEEDEYEDEEIIEEYEEEIEEEKHETPKEEVEEEHDEEEQTTESSPAFDDSTAQQPSLSDSTPSDSRPTHPDPEGITDFATFPPMSEDEMVDEESGGPFISGSTTSMSLNDATDSTASQPLLQPPITTTIDDRPTLPVVDEENQASAQFVPPAREAPSSGPPRIPVTPPIEKETRSASPMWYWAVFALICGLLGGGAYVGWYLVNKDQKNAPDLNEDQTRAPTAAPTVGRTTAFDPIQGNCDFQDLRHPHVIDQCNCVGEIQIIPDDVRTRYKSRKANFIPTIYQQYNDTITDCTPRNQALVWISSGNDYEFTYEERVERFALATLYASTDGTQWKRNDGWFSEESVCTWDGIVCFKDDGMVQTVDLSNNNLKGKVSASCI
jgi:hypothetical protein